ncbi:hypothetical protein FC83_GL002831 [Agrilactobacillus composti DSM 18527 = JCM 14202]|uniref:Surface layer protein A domain-containing protein n=1 Tax=Agrilactobacillus composti DSM 18527 = JCM 14202 TaxID=1423734 RepID=X0PSA0_9LACO|nr:SLAP domain-containing protein [Agrilactobacillus composti]KRM33440.1 hypothetical protein FC83_GL002831 [Agrilactobacillus composti DSM 18527 = JCM 14202]GAF40777.1 hypothetical protein JCM14202_2684 [Agrilactobacillus composti DSM 18527 = JCM 14202]
MKTNKMIKLILMGIVGFSLGIVGFGAGNTTGTVQAAEQVGYVNYIPGEGIPVYASPNGDKTGAYLPTGSAWKIQDTNYDPKVGTWFKVGDSQWVNADFMVNKSDRVYDNGVAFEYNAVVTVNTPTTVYMIPGGYATSQVLNTGTSWQALQVTTAHDGTTWYNVGLNQWIPGNNVTISNYVAN